MIKNSFIALLALVLAPAASWAETFTNDEYGYSIEVDDSFELVRNDRATYFRSKENNGVIIIRNWPDLDEDTAREYLQRGYQDHQTDQDAHDAVVELGEIWTGMSRKNHREYLHDAQEKHEELLAAFQLGYLSLRDRAIAERLLRRIRREALAFAKEERFLPDEFRQLEKGLVTKYIANFSVFQSIPDSWALDQLFPVVPIHRLGERPTVEATLCDVTCDSDGEIDRFVDLRDVRTSLPMHELGSDPYYVAVLLIGAYQDVLGDYHNLFGRVDEAHVTLTAKGAARISHVSQGDDAQDVIGLFGHDVDKMREALEAQVTQAVESKSISKAKAKRILSEYTAALEDYTYLSF